MLVGTTDIVTPFDNALQFDPAWRYQVARGWLDDPTFVPAPEIAGDKYICAFRDYLIQSNAAERDALVEPRLKIVKTVLDWYAKASMQAPKYYIEPLLLTGATYDAITADMGGGKIPKDAFKLYERLFFNVREDNDEVTTSCYRRTYCALPDNIVISEQTPEHVLWRVIANQYGYAGLMRIWFWRGYAGPSVDEVALQREFMNMAQALIMRRMIRGQINSFDLNTIFTNYIQYERMRQETGKDQDLSTTPETLLLKVLGIMRPQMLTASQSADELLTLNKALQDRIEAQKAVQSKSIVDRGLEGGIEKLNAVIDQHFTDEPTADEG